MPRYARNGDVNLAYDVFGEGERDILVTFGWIGSFQSAYEHPAHTRWLRRLGTSTGIAVNIGAASAQTRSPARCSSHRR